MTSKPPFQARKFADAQLSLRIQDAGLRSWLLMNMRQDLKTREIGWRINIDGIHAAFKSEIAKIVFPEQWWEILDILCPDI